MSSGSRLHINNISGFPLYLEIREKLENAFHFFQLGKRQGIWEKCLKSGKSQFDEPKSSICLFFHAYKPCSLDKVTCLLFLLVIVYWAFCMTITSYTHIIIRAKHVKMNSLQVAKYAMCCQTEPNGGHLGFMQMRIKICSVKVCSYIIIIIIINHFYSAMYLSDNHRRFT